MNAANQRLVGGVLLALLLLGSLALFADLDRRPPGKSRVDWPGSTSPSP